MKPDEVAKVFKTITGIRIEDLLKPNSKYFTWFPMNEKKRRGLRRYQRRYARHKKS